MAKTAQFIFWIAGLTIIISAVFDTYPERIDDTDIVVPPPLTSL